MGQQVGAERDTDWTVGACDEPDSRSIVSRELGLSRQLYIVGRHEGGRAGEERDRDVDARERVVFFLAIAREVRSFLSLSTMPYRLDTNATALAFGYDGRQWTTELRRLIAVISMINLTQAHAPSFAHAEHDSGLEPARRANSHRRPHLFTQYTTNRTNIWFGPRYTQNEHTAFYISHLSLFRHELLLYIPSSRRHYRITSRGTFG
jgi:hypothetical protein